MIFLKFTYVDVKTAIPATQSPMRNGPKMPDVEGLEWGFALESAFPVDAPVMFGTCPDGSDTDKPGVLETITESQFNHAMNSELAERKVIARRQIDKIRDSHLFKNIPYTFPGDTEPDAVQLRDERDRQNLQDNNADAMKHVFSGNPDTEMHFMPLSNQQKTLTAQQMLDMTEFIKNRGDAIYATSWQKKNIDTEGAATFSELKAVVSGLDEGWPE